MKIRYIQCLRRLNSNNVKSKTHFPFSTRLVSLVKREISESYERNDRITENLNGKVRFDDFNFSAEPKKLMKDVNPISTSELNSESNKSSLSAPNQHQTDWKSQYLIVEKDEFFHQKRFFNFRWKSNIRKRWTWREVAPTNSVWLRYHQPKVNSFSRRVRHSIKQICSLKVSTIKMKLLLLFSWSVSSAVGRSTFSRRSSSEKTNSKHFFIDFSLTFKIRPENVTLQSFEEQFVALCWKRDQVDT